MKAAAANPATTHRTGSAPSFKFWSGKADPSQRSQVWPKAGGKVVGCPVCKRLERTFEGWNSECVRARSSLYDSISTRFAAYDNVEMERARSELQMHRSVCLFPVAKPVARPAVRPPSSRKG